MLSIISRLPYMSRILFSSIAKHVRIASDACCCIFNIKPAMVSKHSELGRGRLETAIGSSLLPLATVALLFLLHARRWEALA
jgi:hypothetical protein